MLNLLRAAVSTMSCAFSFFLAFNFRFVVSSAPSLTLMVWDLVVLMAVELVVVVSRFAMVPACKNNSILS